MTAADPVGAAPDPELLEGELQLQGRIMQASNATFLGEIGETLVVYKPIAGERPLWDFPDGTLAFREVAAHVLSEATGWGIVPPTYLRDGPHGPGMVQLWREPDEQQAAVTIVPEGAVPEGFRHVFDGLDAYDHPISLVHEDTVELRRMVVLDVLLNNADRKGGHVLEMADGHRHGVDHGVCFHVEHKLRTVLWGWAGEALTTEEQTVVEQVRRELDGDLGEVLLELLTPDEVEATRRRAERLLAADRLPGPRGRGPAIPWPPF